MSRDTRLGNRAEAIYGLIDEISQWYGYVGRSIDPAKRMKCHLAEGYRLAAIFRHFGCIPLPVTIAKANWLAYLVITQKPIGLRILEHVGGSDDAFLAEAIWGKQLISKGQPIANGYRGITWLGGEHGRNPFEDCPYTTLLVASCGMHHVRDFMSYRVANRYNLLPGWQAVAIQDLQGLAER